MVAGGGGSTINVSGRTRLATFRAQTDLAASTDFPPDQ